MSDFISDEFTFVNATDKPMHALGTEKAVGEKRYLYVRNGSSVVGTANYPAMEDYDAAAYSCGTSFLVTADVDNTTTHACLGVYMATMAVNEYGWIQTRGYHSPVMITAAITVIGQPIKVVTDGYFDLANAAGDIYCGRGVEITTAASNTVAVWLDCPSKGYGGTT